MADTWLSADGKVANYGGMMLRAPGIGTLNFRTEIRNQSSILPVMITAYARITFSKIVTVRLNEAGYDKNVTGDSIDFKSHYQTLGASISGIPEGVHYSLEPLGVDPSILGHVIQTGFYPDSGYVTGGNTLVYAHYWKYPSDTTCALYIVFDDPQYDPTTATGTSWNQTGTWERVYTDPNGWVYYDTAESVAYALSNLCFGSNLPDYSVVSAMLHANTLYYTPPVGMQSMFSHTHLKSFPQVTFPQDVPIDGMFEYTDLSEPPVFDLGGHSADALFYHGSVSESAGLALYKANRERDEYDGEYCGRMFEGGTGGAESSASIPAYWGGGAPYYELSSLEVQVGLEYEIHPGDVLRKPEWPNSWPYGASVTLERVSGDVMFSGSSAISPGTSGQWPDTITLSAGLSLSLFAGWRWGHKGIYRVTAMSGFGSGSHPTLTHYRESVDTGV